MEFLRNAWYAAGWSDHIGADPITRTMLNVPLVLFRYEGKVVALHDRCPHRFAPLSMGTVVEGGIRCGYHGLTFDTSGNCIRNLFSPVAPKAAKVRRFEVHELDRMVWIWMGDGEASDTSEIPQLTFHHEPDRHCVFGYTHAKSSYLLLSDNLMDLTHTALLHPSFGGLDYIPAYKSWDADGEIVSQYTIDELPSFSGDGRTIYMRDEARWIAPTTYRLMNYMREVTDGPTSTLPSAHILTPETATSSHYFWSSATPPHSRDAVDRWRQLLVKAFDHEDKPMVESVQKRMGDAGLWDLDPVLLPTDAGSVRVRRRLDALIRAELGRTEGLAAS